MPMNMRPPTWRHDFVSNCILFGMVSTRRSDRTDFTSTVAAVSRWTKAYKATNGAGVQVVLEKLGRSPIWLKWLIVRLLPGRAWDITFSNLGRLPELGQFGHGAGRVVETGSRRQWSRRWALASERCQ